MLSFAVDAPLEDDVDEVEGGVDAEVIVVDVDDDEHDDDVAGVVFR